MIRSRALVAIALAILALASSPAAAGQSGFAFLEVPVGARAAALGGAYSSVAVGAEAAFWNPAGLATFRGTQVVATHVETWEGLRHEQVAMAGRQFGGGLAGSIRAMYSEPIPARDALGNLTGSFGAHDLEFLVGYGATARPGLDLGVTTQVVRERLDDAGATTWAVGAGAVWQPSALPGVRTALTLQHLGRNAHYTIDGTAGQPVPLPLALHTGASYSGRVGRDLQGLAALDARLTRGRRMVLALGGELAFPVGAALRMGMRAHDDAASWSAGVGWRTGPIAVDYAYVPAKLDLTDTHRFSLSAQF